MEKVTNKRAERWAKLLVWLSGKLSNRFISGALFVIMAYFLVYWIFAAIYYPIMFMLELFR